MNEIQFIYWMQGFFEISGVERGLTERETQIIKDHLALVFDKQTPDRLKMIDKDKLLERIPQSTIPKDNSKKKGLSRGFSPSNLFNSNTKFC